MKLLNWEFTKTEARYHQCERARFGSVIVDKSVHRTCLKVECFNNSFIDFEPRWSCTYNTSVIFVSLYFMIFTYNGSHAISHPYLPNLCSSCSTQVTYSLTVGGFLYTPSRLPLVSSRGHVTSLLYRLLWGWLIIIFITHFRKILST